MFYCMFDILSIQKIFAGFSFLRNLAYAMFSEYKTIMKWRNHSVVY